MFNLDLRMQIIQLLSPLLGSAEKAMDSRLLQAYSTLLGMRKTGIIQPQAAYAKIREQYTHSRHGLLTHFNFPSEEQFFNICTLLSTYSYIDFLTYVVPGIACDPQQTVDLFHKEYPENSDIELTHHIIQIRFLLYRLREFSFVDNKPNGYDNVLDALYAAYRSCEKGTALPKALFLKLYSSINTYHLAPQTLAPHTLGFSSGDINTLMHILSGELQMTRSHQVSLIARYLIDKEQAAQIVSQNPFFFHTSIDTNACVKLVSKALRLITKIPPLELLCAISICKRGNRVSEQRRTDGLILPNDVTLELGFVYPIFRNCIGFDPDTSILLYLPSSHFLRKLFSDNELRNRRITILLPDEQEVALVQQQVNAPEYANPNLNLTFMAPDEFLGMIWKSEITYDKIFLFGNHLLVHQQSSELDLLIARMSKRGDLYALLSTHVLEHSVKSFLEHDDDDPLHLQSVVLIPQGINNSTSPRRKVWIHCNYLSPIDLDPVTKIITYTLDTSLKTQAISPVLDAPLELRQSDFVQMQDSIRERFAKELILRRSSGRTRSMAFQHEITPDIPVWCSRTFPNGPEKNPRLEAYVCLPAPEEKTKRGYSARGSILPSTKKHTTHVSQTEVLDWLENVYPFSSVLPRYTQAELKQQGGKFPLKPTVQIRYEIIEQYTPILKNQNIALKTLWYLYPNLENLYTGSDYQILTQMMQTVIGQQRVCDITDTLCEALLMELYPDLSETALWRNFTILSTALEKAVSYGYCPSNPLAAALKDEKLRRKLFAQVKRQLVKKHLTETELRAAHRFITMKLQNGEYEYFGVLVRLLTGLESNIVCALRWCDLIHYPNMDVSSFVITRQASNDGKSILGFSDAEDYICYPLPSGLRSLIEQYKKQLVSCPENQPILSTLMQLAPKSSLKTINPSQLNLLTRNTLQELNIEERIIHLAYGDNEFRKINLNKYAGDFIRENFRYWATKSAQLLPDELSFLLRNRAPSTLGRFYCDFLNEASQAILSAKLSRLECLFMQTSPPQARRTTAPRVYSHTSKITPKNGYRQKVSLEITNAAAVELQLYCPMGLRSDVCSLDEKDGETS